MSTITITLNVLHSEKQISVEAEPGITVAEVLNRAGYPSPEFYQVWIGMNRLNPGYRIYVDTFLCVTTAAMGDEPFSLKPSARAA